jgi:hypothetical protein
MEFTDRYQALGIPYPDPETMCKGDCEGTGYVPVAPLEDDPVLRVLWEAAEEAEPSDDGWHFVVCPTCNGTRLAAHIDGSATH